MKVDVFKGRDGRYALLTQDDRVTLPEEFGPWKRLDEMEISPGDPDRVGVPTAVALKHLEERGSHFFQLSITIE